MFNSVFAGAVASFDNYCRDEMGCPEITPEEAVAFDQQYFKEKREALAAMPLHERLFSLQSTNSLASALIMRTPTSPAAGFGKLASIVGGTPGTVASMFSQRADAEEWVDLIGKNPRGEKPGDEEGDIPEVLMQPGGTCPEKSPDPNRLDQCKAYKVAIDSVQCAVVGCPDVTTDGGSAAELTGAAGAKVDYTKLYKVYNAGEVPNNLLCSMGPDYEKRPGLKLLCGAPVESFKAMNEAFKQKFGKPMPVGQGYRTAAEQKECVRVNSACNNYNPNQTPPSHLWGTSIDFDTSYYKSGDEYQKWTVENGPKYGWYWPNWAREGRGGVGGHVEPWHFDYYFVGHDGSTDRLEGFQR